MRSDFGKLIFGATVAAALLSAQDVYLRLTDYGSGKSNIVIEPFVLKGSSDYVVRASALGKIVRDDLEYSLYFEIFPDTSYLVADPGKTGVVLRAKGVEPQLTVSLIDFGSHEEISVMTVTLSDDSRAPGHSLADSIIERLTGERGIASTRICLAYLRSKTKQIALIDYDGYNFTAVTDNQQFNLFPEWGPGAQQILYSTYGADRLNLRRYDLSTGKSSLVSASAGLNYAPCWSPDGSLIALTLTKDGNAEIYALDVVTKKMRRLTENHAIDCSPAFSPNGRELAFVSDRSGSPQIYLMDIHGGNARRLTFHGNYNTSPAWSPRGDLIAYVSREGDNTQQIYVTDPNDFLPIRLTGEGNNEDPSWSPDGLHLVFASNREGAYELFSMNWDGTRQRKLTRGITAFAPDWSPYK